MKLLLLSLVFLISSFVWVSALDPVTSSVYLKQLDTGEIKIFSAKNYEKKSFFEIWVLSELHEKNIGDSVLFWKYEIIQVCTNARCWKVGELYSGGYHVWLSMWAYDVEPFDEIRDNSIGQLKGSEFSIIEKIKLIPGKSIVSLIVGFFIFLPMNLLVFHCFWYALYLLCYKKYKIEYFKMTYLNAGICYFISFCILYLTWNGFINYNASLLWFMFYFYVIGTVKLILFLVSRYTIEQMKKRDKQKHQIDMYVYSLYLILFILFIMVSTLMDALWIFSN